MANIKSAIKRNRQNEKRRQLNRIFRGSARTRVKDAKEVIVSGDKEKATAEVNKAIQKLDRAAAKGIVHKNNAARRKSRLMKRLASMEK